VNTMPDSPLAWRDTEGREHRLEDRAGRWLLLVYHRHLA